ncbi:hypothetical protein [Alloscardovia omnicolens]|uniref:variant leucine-rich repeat-containing protein n=1 Tax=Alloscardovia omnicolens TaxID=419015 RepID=UPI003A6FCE1B
MNNLAPHHSLHHFYPGSPPPPPPIKLTPAVATNPETSSDILWHIARHVPELRYWLIANASASAELLEFVSQAGGPHVKESFDVLFDSS